MEGVLLKSMFRYYLLYIFNRAEEDAILAKTLIEEEQIKLQANKMAIELTDEVGDVRQ